jgi:hypothetical protein
MDQSKQVYWRCEMPTEKLSDFAVFVPEWAHGCAGCVCGLVDPPPLPNLGRGYGIPLERLGQYKLSMFTTCECRAGQARKAGLLNLERKYIEEAKRHPMMQEFAKDGTHPDIVSVMNLIVMEMPAPTIHMDTPGERDVHLAEFASTPAGRRQSKEDKELARQRYEEEPHAEVEHS